MEYAFKGDSLVFEGRTIAPSVRTFGQMEAVLAFPEKGKACGLAQNSPLYYMYRKVLAFGPIRYDVTRILPTELCGEKNKTLGHSHPLSPAGVAFPEIYEVLSGEAHFLIQKVSTEGKVEDALFLSAKKGDCFLIPPGYGHVSINAGKMELLLANLVSEEFESDYSHFKEMRGACFYETSKGEILMNKSYGTGFELKKGKALEFSSSFACFAPFRKGGLLGAARDYKNIAFLERPGLFR